ncbi:pyridoxal phosphate-dependent aminotransferase [Prochlorococcus marinus]|uniref:pyridoxal phosphate-dependent aminotransferase n=1 Tax=Prochlorococcus marinus TaxID=1219 RepID=UPI0022B4E389|nr:pyridoxal phosphate-dependent aminotransferase [Prochlorococcus marinus]
MSASHVISQRALSLEPSLTLEISSLAQTLKKQGRNICSLSAGEPDYDTPDFIVEAAIKALKDGVTRYGPAAGDQELRDAIANKLTNINKTPSNIENILITNGGKQAIFNLCQVILNIGDEVLLPSPYWLSYPQIIKLAGGIPITLPSSAENNFKLDIAKLKNNITNKTKLLILNSPCNPTGRVMKRSELEEIIDIAVQFPNLNIISDEIYEYLIDRNQEHISISSITPDLKDRIFIVNGFAKAWAMTGWRVGYLRGAKDIIKKCIALQSQSTSNVCSFAQRGALAAITKSMRGIDYMIENYNSRRDLLLNGLKEIDGLLIKKPEGAFYAFPYLNNDLPNSLEFCKTALENQGLAIVPGVAFGDDRCIRISCAVSENTIIDGLNRLKRVIINSKLSK